jgi:ABC-type branched-subunit amino acid transport system substrate-binding protein
VQWGSTGLQIFSKSGVPSFNCQNTQQDYTDPMSFGIAPSGIAEYRGMAKFLCTQADVKKIVLFNPDIPQQHEIAADTVAPTLKTCGKSAGYVYYPITATDLTPYVQKTLDLKPDFIMTTGSGAVQYLRAFKTAGFPSEKIWTSSNNIAYSTVLKPAGDAANGLYSTLEFNNWDDQTADIAAYTKAVTANGDDPRDPGVEWGYSAIMFFHEAAKRIGFDAFDAASLTKFMQSPSSNGTPIPLSRPMKEGPKDYPAVRQTDVQVVQWKDGHLNTVTSFGNDGWIYGF